MTNKALCSETLVAECPVHDDCVLVRVGMDDQLYVVEMAESRQAGAKKDGKFNARGLRTSQAGELNKHTIGCHGEFAAAFYLYPDSGGRILTEGAYRSLPNHPPDLPPDIEVKCRTRADFGILVDDKDNLDYRFLLAQDHQWPSVHLRGWCPGHDVIAFGFVKDWGGRGKPVHTLDPPHVKLQPMLRLLESVQCVKSE